MTQSIQTFFRWYILSINLDYDLHFTITTYAMSSHTSRIELTHQHSINISIYETCTSLRRGKPHRIYTVTRPPEGSLVCVAQVCVSLSIVTRPPEGSLVCVTLSAKGKRLSLVGAWVTWQKKKKSAHTFNHSKYIHKHIQLHSFHKMCDKRK